MWVEKRNDHFRMYERYTDPITGKSHKVSVPIERNTAQQRNKAQPILDKIITDKTLYNYCVDFKTLCGLYNLAKSREVKPQTQRRNERETRILLNILGNVKMDALTAGYVKNKLLKYNPKPSTINEHIQRFKEIIKWGYQNDLVEDISFLMKLTKVKDTSRHVKAENKYLEAEECKILLDALPKNYSILAEFMILSGLRVGEALALKKEDLDFENRRINVDKTVDPVTQIVGTPKTSASVRQVYMQDDLYDLCKEIVRRSDPISEGTGQTALFYTKFKTPANYAAFNKCLREVSERVLGRRITTHVLRHTHASLLAEQDAIPNSELMFEMIQKRLGHENSRVTKDIYVHVTQHRQETFDAMTKELHLL